ncbi:hypothetical protein IIA15_05065, partial [candidate division TA06 bacterium]|nr:hypothetical protein [candidate division TA06 bacterium]
TVNDIGAQLVGGNAWLAMLPGGTENLMCRSAGSPAADAGAAVEHLLQAKPVRWDVGVLGDRLFFGIAGIGFDAQICARAEGVWRQRLGQVMYWLAAAAQVPRKPQRYTLKWPGGQLSGVHEAIFSNVNRYGGGLVVNAQADPTDGWLDLAVFPWTGYLGRVGQFLTLLPWSWAKKFPGPARFRIQRAEINAEESLWAHVDGEPFLVRNPSLSLRAGALWVLSDLRDRSG